VASLVEPGRGCDTRNLGVPSNERAAAIAVDVETLEESFDLVAPQGDELMRKFYDHLFEAAPSVQPLFADVDMERQRQALLNMLVVLRESLRDLEDIVPDLEDLGARHVEYGAQAAHYPVVGEVLIGAMAEIAGDAWKPEYTAAWQEAYGVVQGVMLSGAAAKAE
jgi:hemoglobin-like flavoprotein